MRSLLLFLAASAMQAAVIAQGLPAFGVFPTTNCAFSSFPPAISLTPTASGFKATGTMQMQLSGPTLSGCTVSWSASVLMLITPGVIAVNVAIDAFVNIPLNAAPLATFATRTTLFGVAQVDTSLPLANGQQFTVFNQVTAVSNSLSGTLLGQECTFTVCPGPTGGTVFFHIPVSAGVTELPEPHSFVLVPLGAGRC